MDLLFWFGIALLFAVIAVAGISHLVIKLCDVVDAKDKRNTTKREKQRKTDYRRPLPAYGSEQYWRAFFIEQYEEWKISWGIMKCPDCGRRVNGVRA